MTESAVAWLRRMRGQLRAARAVAVASQARLAPEFCALSYLRTDEYGISRILADLLDPKGSHGQGSSFLKAFLASHWPEVQPHAACARIKLESATDRIANSRRRIDIEVSFGPHAVLGIENKAWGAVEQDNQVSDYLAHLTRKCANHRLIYLTHADELFPSDKSIIKADRIRAVHDGRLLPLGFPALRAWLRECIGLCESGRVRTFVDELIRYIESDFMGIESMTENNLIMEAATRSAEDVRDALQIVAAGDAIKHALLERYKCRLAPRIREILPPGWGLFMSDRLDGAYSSIRMMPNEKPTHCVELSFEAGGANNVIVGVASTTQSTAGMDDAAAALNEGIGNGRKSAIWPWYRSFDVYPDWGRSVDAMQAIMDDGEDGMVELTLRQIKAILLVLETRKLMDRFGS